MNFLKAHRFFKADSPRFSRRDEAKIANEEDSVLVDCFFFDALKSAASNAGGQEPSPVGKRVGRYALTDTETALLRIPRDPPERGSHRNRMVGAPRHLSSTRVLFTEEYFAV